MALLLYCALPVAVPVVGFTGVGGAEIRSWPAGGLQLAYSEIAADDALLKNRLREGALAFHAVLDLLLPHATMVPFRFPTLIGSTQELAEYATARTPAFAAELERLAGMVQMEIVLDAGSPGPAPTGTDYLRARQTASRAVTEAAENAQQAAGGVALAVKTLPSMSGVRVCFLVDRDRVAEFRSRFAPSAGRRVTGPWPPSAFLSPELQPQETPHG
jgi:hypothetical protein